MRLKKIKLNSPSKPKEMPEDFIPLHFLPWLKNGPASNNQHPLWIPDTGKAQLKQKADILDLNENATGSGKQSSYSRKTQRLQLTQKTDGESKVLDLTAEDATSGLLRESVKNSGLIVSLLQGVNDQERKNIDALVLNACKMYELEPNQESKGCYLTALKKQKELLERRVEQPVSVKREPTRHGKVASDSQLFSDDEFNPDCHNLDNSLSDEAYLLSSPLLGNDSPTDDYSSSSCSR